MATYRVARWGAEQEPVSPVRLVAGKLTANLIGAELFSVRWGELEVIQRLYVAVRDAPWNTIPGELTAREITQSAEGFNVTFSSRHRFESIDFEWTGSIIGHSDGTLVYEMEGRALRGFECSKIGLNIHHGLAVYRGRDYSARTRSGAVTGVLPEEIDPQLIKDGNLTAMFDYFDHISFDLDGTQVAFEFEGDQFEMQDHRNWSDVNYKTYGTPLSFGFPHDAQANDEFRQKVTVRMDSAPEVPTNDGPLIIRPRLVKSRIPAVGHEWGTAENLPDGALDSVRPDFLRVDVAESESFEKIIQQARLAIDGTDIKIELVIGTNHESVDGDSSRVVDYFQVGHADIARLVILENAAGFSAMRTATPPEFAETFRNKLRSTGLDIPVLSGTDQFFNEINRARPDYAGLDGIAFSLNPQVHACDDISLMQNASGIVDIASSCRRLYPNAVLSVGPVHLLGKSGPYPAGPPASGGPQSGPDPRQNALFGAAWTVAFLEACTIGDVDAVTLFDLAGDNGVVHANSEGTLRGSALQWILGRRHRMSVDQTDRCILPTESDERLALFGWPTATGSRIFVANLQNVMLDVRLALDDASAKIVTLDETTIEENDIRQGEVEFPEFRTLTDGLLPMVLRPFAVACIDTSSEFDAG